MALTDEYIARLKELKKDLTKIEGEISATEDRIRGLVRSLKYWKKLMNDPDSYYRADAFNFAIGIISGYAKDLLWRSIKNGAEETREYNDPRFLDGLKLAVEDDRTITIEYNQSDFTIKNVLIDLNLTAGTLEEWAGAISGAREMLRNARGGRYIKDTNVASKVWAEKIYKAGREGGTVYRRRRVKEEDDPNVSSVDIDVTAKYKDRYWETIALRFHKTKSPAPWWQLLDQGNVALKGAGTPYPVNGATNFVSNTIESIKINFDTIMYNNIVGRRKSAEWNWEYDAKRVEEVKAYLKELNLLKDNKGLEEYVKGFIKGEPPPPPEQVTQPFDKVLERVAERLTELHKLEKADIPGLTKLIKNMVNGQFPAGKVRLGRDVRIRVKRIQNMIEAELGKWYTRQ